MTLETMREEGCPDAQRLVDIMLPPIIVARSLITGMCTEWTFEPQCIRVQLADGKEVSSSFLQLRDEPALADVWNLDSHAAGHAGRSRASPTRCVVDPLIKNVYYWIGGAVLDEVELRQLCLECGHCQSLAPTMLPAEATYRAGTIALQLSEISDAFSASAHPTIDTREKTSIHWSTARGASNELRQLRQLLTGLEIKCE